MLVFDKWTCNTSGRQTVFFNDKLWDRLEKSVRLEEFTFPGDPMRLDYSYRRNGTRGFVQTLSVTAKASLKTEFAAVSDVALEGVNDRNRFVRGSS